jgi:hypothetical protein
MDGCNILEDNDISTRVIVTETLRDSNSHQDVGCVHAIRFELIEDTSSLSIVGYLIRTRGMDSCMH